MTETSDAAAEKWLPEYLMGECSPPSRPSPDDWIIRRIEGGVVIGDDEDPDGKVTIAEGEMQEFYSFRYFGSFRLRIGANDHEALDPVPEGHATMWGEDDPESIWGDSVDELVGTVRSTDAFADGAYAEPLTIHCGAWSGPVPHRLTRRVDGSLGFERLAPGGDA